MKSKFDIGVIENWGLLLTFLFVIFSMIYELRDPFTSSFFMNMAFTIFGSVIIASLLDRLLKERESARWSSFDVASLAQVHNAIYHFLFQGLFLVTYQAMLREGLNERLKGSGFLQYNVHDDPERFREHANELLQCLRFLYKNHKRTLGNVGLKHQKNLLRELTSIDGTIRYLAVSPYVPIDSLTALQSLSGWETQLRDCFHNEWDLDQNDQADTTALPLLGTVECALEAYLTISSEIRQRARK